MSALSERLRRAWLSLILGLITMGLVINCLTAPKGASDLIVLRQNRMALEAELRRLTTENAELETKAEKLRSDDRYIERLVRSELGFARPGELVYRFDPDAPDADR